MGDQIDTNGSKSLEEMSAIEFNDKLISQTKLLCKNCSQFLWPPIMISKDGNICGGCYKDGIEGYVHNSLLELVLQGMSIPCIYAENGCEDRNKYFEMAAHATNCSYRNYNCPMNVFHNCQWLGYYNGFLQHFVQEHSTSVGGSETNTYTFNIDITDNGEYPLLLSLPCGTFMLVTKCDLTIQKLSFFIFYVGDPKSANEFQFVLQQKGLKNTFEKHETRKCDVLPITSYSKACTGFDIDLDLVKSLISTDKYECTLQMCLKENGNKNLNENLLRCFECPVCNNYMRPPIYQCLSGHSICHRCRPKMAQCPTCRSGFGSTRNYALEEFSNGIYYPCIYREEGCMRTFLVGEINKHEMECSLRPYNCPFSEMNPFMCKWSGVQSKVSSHLKEEHSDLTYFVNHHKTTIPFAFDRQFFELYCLVIYGKVFRVCHKRDQGNQNSYWSLQLVGPRGEAKNYKCEVGLIDERAVHRRLVRFDVCQDFTNHDNLFNQSIMIPTNITSWFSSNSQLTYYVKVIRTKSE